MLMIEKLYSRHYHIEALYVSPAHQGHAGMARERVYLILSHRKKLKQVAEPVDLYKDFVSKKQKNV